MDYTIWIYIGVPLLIIYLWYANLISKRNHAKEALSGIDVQLKKRSNLIPNILKIAKRFMEHEKSLLTEITALREKAEQSYDEGSTDAVKEHLVASEVLAGKMSQLMLKAEEYPDLKSDQTMVQAMQTYNEVEAQISAARRFYNSSVTTLNNSIQIFPGNLIAKLAGVQQLPFYKADDSVHAPINAEDHL